MGATTVERAVSLRIQLFALVAIVGVTAMHYEEGVDRKAQERTGLAIRRAAWGRMLRDVHYVEKDMELPIFGSQIAPTSDVHRRRLKLLDLISSLGEMLGSVRETASSGDDDDNDSKPAVCKCERAEEVVNAVIVSCGFGPDDLCCSALETAGARNIVGCECEMQVSCETSPFDGPFIMNTCGYKIRNC